MSKKIVVNGCSLSQEAYFVKEDRWSTNIGAEINLAHGGGSNDRIFFTTTEYLMDNTCDTLIVGWTDPSRYMMPLHNGSRLSITNGRSFDEQLGTDYPALQKSFYLYNYNMFTSFYNTLVYMIHLQQVCDLMNIKMLHWNALLPEIDDSNLRKIATAAFIVTQDENKGMIRTQYNFNKLKSLLRRTEKFQWIGSHWYSIFDHCRDFGWRSDGHPKQEGSKHWAKIVKDHL
jgi:hypothetical protein